MNKVSILLSIYKPNVEFLRKQLISLNEQTYENLDLIVWNDCPDDTTDYTLIFDECIKNFKYRMFNENKNLGYTKAFEKLVTLADGYYVSFCDQDDIWKSDKIKKCVEELEKENGSYVVCDKGLIDSNNNLIKESVRRTSKKSSETWSTGDYITDKAIFVCFATGMSIIAKREDVLSVTPFPITVAHDRWLAVALSVLGKPVFLEEPLVLYRRTGKNATGVLNGINSKKDYYKFRADNTIAIESFENFFPDYKNLAEIKSCNRARISGSVFKIIKYRRFIPDLYLYEVFLSLCPDFLFKSLKKLLF